MRKTTVGNTWWLSLPLILVPYVIAAYVLPNFMQNPRPLHDPL